MKHVHRRGGKGGGVIRYPWFFMSLKMVLTVTCFVFFYVSTEKPEFRSTSFI